MTTPQFGSLTRFNNGDIAANGENIVNAEAVNFDTNIFSFNIPGTSIESGTYSFGFLPKRSTLFITGQFRGTEAQISSFVGEIEGIINISNQVARVYTSTLNRTYTVKINGFTHNKTKDTPNNIDYTLELIRENT